MFVDVIRHICMTCQHLEVRVRQHIPRSLLSGRLTFGHPQAMDSTIGEHLLTINSCRTSYEDDCVTRKIYFYPITGLYFRTCEDGTDWHLIPRRISPRSEFFSSGI